MDGFTLRTLKLKSIDIKIVRGGRYHYVSTRTLVDFLTLDVSYQVEEQY